MKKLLSFLILLLIILGVIGYFLPTNFSVNKSINISSNSAHIHDFVGDLNKWQEWTVWKGDDPEIEIFIGEKTKGIGANQRWTDKHGGGSLTFTSWSPDNGIECGYMALFSKFFISDMFQESLSELKRLVEQDK